MRTRLAFVLTAILGLACVALPAPAAAQDDAASVTGAGEATFPAGSLFSGVRLNGLTLGQGLLIAQDGSAKGEFHVVLQGTSLLGLAQDVTVDGKVNAGSVAGNGSVTFSGTATLDMGDGTVPMPDVPFTVTVSAQSLALILNLTTLPIATLSAGSITIE